MKTSIKLLAVIALAGSGTAAFADTPRTLKNGRPAPGNVVRSRGKSMARDEDEPEAAKLVVREVGARAIGRAWEDVERMFLASVARLQRLAVVATRTP